MPKYIGDAETITTTCQMPILNIIQRRHEVSKKSRKGQNRSKNKTISVACRITLGACPLQRTIPFATLLRAVRPGRVLLDTCCQENAVPLDRMPCVALPKLTYSFHQPRVACLFASLAFFSRSQSSPRGRVY